MANLMCACKKLSALGEDFCYSSVYETEAWGFDADQQFLNLVLRFHTSLLPEELLEEIHSIEKKLGRIRSNLKTGYESRPIDIDILFWGDKIINTENLVVPHPQLQYRKFVLVPLNEIAADYFHPVLKKHIQQLLLECSDNCNVVLNNKFTHS